MEDNTQSAQTRKKLPLIRIALIVIIAAILTITIIFAVNWYNQNQLINQVKAALINASSSEVNQATANKAGYSVTLPDAAFTNKDVNIQGSGSFDGTSYCITGTSVKDKKIVYYISSFTKTVQKGSCETAAKPASTGPLAIDLLATDHINASWYAAPYADTYTLQCATDKAFATNLVTSSSKTTTAACSNLTQGTTYYVRVRGDNQAGAGPWSSVVTVITHFLSVTPTNLKITPLSSTEASYSWSPVVGAVAYIVEWSPDIDFIKNVQTVSQTSVSGISKKLVPGTLYWYHVKAVTANFDASHAAFSAQISMTTPIK